MTKQYGFRKQLLLGNEAEVSINLRFPSWKRTDGRREDFVLPNGKTLELKSESRSVTATPNLALELHSSSGNPGAIERAVAHGVHYICYMFANKDIFVYRSTELWQYLETNKSRYRNIKINNGSYLTTVVLVPRRDVAHLLCTQEVI